MSGGVGVGAGIVVDGRLLRGSHGFGGELGHLVVDPDGSRCACGARGCLETVVGAEHEATTEVRARALARALTGVVHLLDPAAIALGGTFAHDEELFGQSMGMTVTGLLLMRIADPTNRSGALEAFGYKQLMFEPIVGGGLFTAASLPLIARFGPGWVLALCAALMATWAVVGLRTFGASRTATEERSA